MTERYNSCLYDWLSEIEIAVKMLLTSSQTRVRLVSTLKQCGVSPPDSPLSELTRHALEVILLCEARK
jgi:hypothetical protein